MDARDSIFVSESQRERHQTGQVGDVHVSRYFLLNVALRNADPSPCARPPSHVSLHLLYNADRVHVSLPNGFQIKSTTYFRQSYVFHANSKRELHPLCSRLEYLRCPRQNRSHQRLLQKPKRLICHIFAKISTPNGLRHHFSAIPNH